MGRSFFVQGNEVYLQSPITEENQPRNEVHAQSPKYVVSSYVHKLRVSHLLQKEGGTPHLYKHIMKVVESKGVNVEESLDNTSSN